VTFDDSRRKGVTWAQDIRLVVPNDIIRGHACLLVCNVQDRQMPLEIIRCAPNVPDSSDWLSRRSAGTCEQQQPGAVRI